MAFRLSTDSLASASARKPWFVVVAWVIVLVGAIVAISTLLEDALTTEQRITNNPDSEAADGLLEEWRGETPVNEIVIIRSDELTVDDGAFQAKVESVFNGISALGPGIVSGGTNYFQSGDQSMVSEDRGTTILPFTMAGGPLDADDNIGEVLNVVEKADAAGDFEVLIVGPASINREFQEVAAKDLQTGEVIGISIALIVLVLVFGALTAAIIPIVIAVISIVIAVGVTALLGQGLQVSFFVTNVITMMGLAVGIDYSLFIVSRFREERAKGLDKHDAIKATGATASRAVFFSGLTVVLALLGMLLVPSTIFRSLGAGAVIVVLVSMAVTMTLLPAVISLLGDKVNSLRVPFLGRKLEDMDHEPPGGFWDAITIRVMRFPVISVVVAVTLLVALAIPYVDIQTGTAGVSTLPPTTDAYRAFLIMESEFNAGEVSPVDIVVHDGDVTRDEVQAGVDRLKGELAQNPLYGPPAFETSPDGSTGLLSVALNADPTSGTAVDAVRELRSNLIPGAFADVNAEVYVTGFTASNIDYFDTTNEYTPIVIAFVLTLSFILLTVVFRSLIVPLKAIVMNLLSVGAAYGAMVLVFQKGVGNELLGFQQVDIIEAWVPLWTFSILFGLSMDYHVFLLSRIRERFNKTGDNTESIAFGVRSTAGIITGAALIMASVFAGFALGDLVMFQQMGFGLGVAVILDATIVRVVLVPAAMQLLGKANWYLPPVLNWLPDIRTEGERGPSPETT
ncbi:MAG: MMPL family transporter [Dehalococcoidia bacterium]